MIHESHQMRHSGVAYKDHTGGDASFERGFCENCGAAYSDDATEVLPEDAIFLRAECHGPPILTEADRAHLAVLLSDKGSS